MANLLSTTITGTLTLGDSHIIGNQTTYDNLVLLSSSTESIVLSSSSSIFFNTGGTSLSSIGTTLMYIDSGGNVGIGTTSPSVRLHISGGHVRLNSAGDRLEFQNSNVHITRSGNEMYMAAYSGWRFYDMQGSSTRMFLTNGGNLLIGTTTDAGYKLDVNGTVRMSSNVTVNGEFFTSQPAFGGFPLAPNLIHNSYMNKVTNGVPDGWTCHSNITIEAVSPFTKGFEGRYVSTTYYNANPSEFTTDVEAATGSLTYWYGNYDKGPRIKRGGLGDGWHSYSDGKILKVTGTGVTSGHCYIYPPKEENNLGAKWLFTCWVKITKGLGFGIGTDAGYNLGNGSYYVSKTTTDAGPQGWYRVKALMSTSQITRIDGLAMSLTIDPDANGDIEGYIALPYLANPAYTGTNEDSWAGSVLDKLMRHGMYLHPTTGELQLTGGNLYLDGTFPRIWLRDSDNNPDYSILNGNGTLRIYDDTNNADRFAISSSGNVGIGTTSPAQRLDISQGSLFLSGAGSKYLYIRRYDGLGTHSFGVGSDEKLILSLSGSNPFIVDGGNVLIGTTTDSGYKLDVNGTAKIGGALTIRQGATDQNTSGDSATIPSTTGNEFLRIEGNYTNGQYTHELAKIDRGGNLPLYIRESKGTANSFSNIARFGSHSYSSYEFEVFGDINATGNVTGANLNISNWNTAYGWGNHASVGYLTSSSLTGYATETYVNTAVANLVDSAPGTLDTLNELAAALGDDPNFATTVTNSIATKLPLAGGTLTGNLTLSYAYPRINLEDTNHNSDYSVINDDGNFTIYDATNAAHRLYVKASGNIGIGTTSPSGKLDVRGGKTYLSPLGNWSSGIDSHALVLRNLNDTAFTADALTAYNAHTSWDIENYSTFTASPRVNDASVYTYAGENASASVAITRFVQFNSTNTSPLLDWTFFQWDGAGTSALDLKKPSKLWTVKTYENGATVEKMSLSGDGGMYLAGNLGIGETSPSTKLYIKNTAGDADITLQGSSQTMRIDQNSIRTTTASQIHIFTNNTTTNGIYISSTGNVGIGTTGPDQKFHVHKGSAGAVGSNGNAIITAENSTNGYVQILVPDANESGILFGRPTSDADGGILYNSNVSRGLEFRTGGNAARMVVNSSGNVGIGTTSPAYPLQISSTVGGGGMMSLLNTSSTESSISYRISNGATNTGWVTGNSNNDFFMWSYTLGSQVMTLKPSGNVGIGTTSPGYTLDVNGSLHSTNITIADAIYHEGDTNNYISFGTDTQIFTTAGSERMRITSNGNVGIGTTSPASKLDVKGIAIIDGGTGVSSSGVLHVRQNGDGSANGIALTSSNATSHRIWKDANGKLNFGPSSSPSAFVQDLSGNVGIGTNSPDHSLQIERSDNDHLKLSRSGVGSFELGVASSDALTFSDGGTERMRINGAGNVGIGTTSPSEKLHVTGTILSDQDEARIRFNSTSGTGRAYDMIGGNDGKFYFYDRTATSFRYVIDSSGNVGIGTASPGAKLDVYNGNSRFWHGGTSYYTQFDTNNEINTYTSAGVISTMYLNYKVGGDVNIARGAIVAKSAGNVGIGTTSPSAKLHVVKSSVATKYVDAYSTSVIEDDEARLQIIASDGGSNAAAITLSNGANHWSIHHRGPTVGNYLAFGYANSTSTTDIVNDTNSGIALALLNTGNLGIGTTSPAYKLHVQGATGADGFGMFSAGSSGTSGGIHLGYNGTSYGVLYFDNSNNNTYLVQKYSAGNLILGTNSSEKLRITNGGNVLIGTTTDNGSKLQVNGDASINGINLGRGPSNSITNTVLGYTAYESNVNGTYNTAIGRDALWGNTTGDGNTALGAYALGGSESTNNNTGIGQSALGSLWQTGDDNTAVGNAALGWGYDMQRCTAVGAYALVQNDADYNTALGYYAGFSNVSGTGNLFLGYQAGQNETGSNKLYISNSSTSNLIYGDFSTKYLGFGTTSPGAYMHVKYSSASIAGLLIENDGVGNNAGSLTLRSGTSGGMNMSVTSGGGMYWYSLSNSSNALSLTSSNNLIINGAVDNGKSLQVNGDVFIKGSGSASSTKIFEVQNSSGTSIMDFRGDAYAFFGCGQGGGAASGFIFRYNDTSHVQFTGYNYGNGTASYKPILLDTDLVGRGQGIYVNFGGTGYANPAPTSSTEFAVRGRTSDATENVMELRDSNNAEKFVVKNDGSIVTDGSMGWTGTVSIPNNPPGSQNLEFKNGILINVF